MSRIGLADLRAGRRPADLEGLRPLFESMSAGQQAQIRDWEEQQKWGTHGHSLQGRINATQDMMLRVLGG